MLVNLSSLRKTRISGSSYDSEKPIKKELGPTYDKIYSAIKKGNIDKLKTLIKANPFTLKNYATNEGSSLLHFAAQLGNNEIVTILLEHFDVNSVIEGDKRLETPLMFAIEENKVETVQLLLDHGARVDVPSVCSYYKLFQSACVKGRERIVKNLLDHGIRFYSTYSDLVKVNKSADLFKWDSMLFIIIESDHLGVLEMILRYEEPELRHFLFDTCLSVAFQVQKIDVIMRFARMLTSDDFSDIFPGGLDNKTHVIDLLDHAAKITHSLAGVQANNLSLAVLHGSQEIIKFLLKHGSNVNLRSDEGRTPLALAIECKNKQVVELLLISGANVNMEKSDCLHYHKTYPLYREVYFEMAKVLVRHIVQLQEAGKFVKKDHLEMVNGDEELARFREACRAEVRLIKEQMFVDTSVSLYEVWKAKDNDQLVGYLKNQDIERFIKSKVFASKFAIYKDRMTVKFRMGFERIYLEKRVCNFFLSLSTRKDDQLPKLPATCVHKIINYLNNRDLINLRKSYY